MSRVNVIEHPVGPFSLDRVERLHGERLERGTGVWVRTDPRPWAYAVEFMPAPAADEGPWLVTVEIVVESGSVALGALRADEQSFLVELTFGPGRHLGELRIPTLRGCHGIVVRNTAAGESVAGVVAIGAARSDSTRAASAAAGAAPRFPIDSPYGSTPRGFCDKNIFADQRRLAGAGARVIFDAGAHLGDMASIYEELFPQADIHCFEPTPQLHEHLRRRFGGSRRAVLHQAALADIPGTVALHVNSESATNSLFSFAADAAKHLDPAVLGPGRVIDVPATTIDEVVAAHGVGYVDILKLDVQGAELRVLQGARRTLEENRIGIIVTEIAWVSVYDGQVSPHDLLERLAHHGFALYDFYNFAYDPGGQLLWGDAVFSRAASRAPAVPA